MLSFFLHLSRDLRSTLAAAPAPVISSQSQFCATVNSSELSLTDIDTSGLAPAHLLEALQRALHVLVTPEDVGERALHRVQVGQGGLLLGRHRLQSLLGTQLVALLILCQG